MSVYLVLGALVVTFGLVAAFFVNALFGESDREWPERTFTDDERRAANRRYHEHRRQERIRDSQQYSPLDEE